MQLEHAVIALITILGGVVWKDLQRRIIALESDQKSGDALSIAVAQLTVEVRHLKEQIDKLVNSKVGE